MKHGSRWGSWGAYALLALAVAATTLAFAVLHAWDSPSIPGAAPRVRSRRRACMSCEADQPQRIACWRASRACDVRRCAPCMHKQGRGARIVEGLRIRKRTAVDSESPWSGRCKSIQHGVAA